MIRTADPTKDLVQSECANYFAKQHGISDYCCLEPKASSMKCVYFDPENIDPECAYFLLNVLPGPRFGANDTEPPRRKTKNR